MVKKAVNRLSVLFMMLLGVLPQILLLSESMDCISAPRLWLWILGAALCLWVSACFHRGMLIGMPASAALLYGAYRYFDAVPLTELDDLIDKFSGAYYTHYLSADGYYNYLNAVEDHSFLLLLIAYLLLAYQSSALTSRSGRPFMCLLGSIPLFAACLSVNGIPSYTPVVGMLLFWALVLVSGNYRDDGGSGKTVFSFTVPLLLLLCAILWFNHPEDYRYDEEDISISMRFDKIGQWLSQWLDGQSEQSPLVLQETVWTTAEVVGEPLSDLLWESTDGGMDLTQSYKKEMLEKVFLRVRGDESGVLYLRGVSYGDYRGTAWESAAEAPVSSLGLTARALEGLGMSRSLSLKDIVKLRYALLPYYSALSASSDAGVPGELQPERTRYTAYNGDFSALSATTEEELRYRAYAHEEYTRLPSGTLNLMQELARQAGLDPASPGIVTDVADYIRSAGEYDIDTEPYPSDDYAVWFLTQAHRGYCIHFATAAAAMYRALGIPARITEGFLVRVESGQYVDVNGENAHAWVEIYRDGVGWLPVEVTGRGGLNQIPVEEDDRFPPEQESPDAAEETAEEKPKPTTQPQNTAESPASLPVGIVQPHPELSSDTTAEQSGFLRMVQSILFLALLAAILPLRRSLILAFWRRRFSSPDRNRAAVAIWKRSQRVSRFGGSVPDEIQNCAEKACFSARGVTPEDIRLCRDAFEAQCRTRYDALSVWKRFLFRYIKALC